MYKKTVPQPVSDPGYHWYWLYSLIIVLLILSPSLVILKFSSSLNRQANKLFVSADKAIQYGTPKRLLINSINVDASVESVALTAEGAMDVPVNADNVAWYNLGPKPGEKGSAVIDGHLDKEDQSPAVFANLEKIEIGNTVSIIDDQGQTLTFKVIGVKVFNADDNTDEVFNNNNGSFLNLITCTGSWDAGKLDYDERRVIFTELVQ